MLARAQFTSATGALNTAWSAAQWGTGTVNLNPTAAVSGVHGLVGRMEAGVYTLYITTTYSASGGNALYRYSTDRDSSTIVGSGYTLLATAPTTPATIFMGVFVSPITPSLTATPSITPSASATATFTPTQTSTPSVPPSYVATPTPAPNVWGASSILVLRSNSATAPASSSVSAYIDEINPTTGAIVSAYGPITGPPSGPGRPANSVSLSSAFPSDGWAQRSADGLSLSFMALNVTAGSAWPSASTGIAKVIVLIRANGTISTATYSNTMYTGPNAYLNSAATVDGSYFYTSGTSNTACDAFAGVRYLAGGASGTNVALTGGSLGTCNYNTRFVTTFGGQLYASYADANVRGIYKIGTGLPKTSTTASILPGFSNYQTAAALGATTGATLNTIATFVFENSTSLFFADNGNTAAWHVWWMNLKTTGSIFAPQTNWVQTRTWKWATTDTCFSITGRKETLPVGIGLTSFVIYGVTMSNVATDLGTLWRYVVSTGQGANTPLAVNAAANTKWRAVLLPPYDPNIVLVPPAPNVNSTSMTVPEDSPPGEQH